MHGRCHFWPWFSEFSSVVLNYCCFTLSRSTIFMAVSLTKPQNSFNPLFKAVLYSVSEIFWIWRSGRFGEVASTSPPIRRQDWSSSKIHRRSDCTKPWRSGQSWLHGACDWLVILWRDQMTTTTTTRVYINYVFLRHHHLTHTCMFIHTRTPTPTHTLPPPPPHTHTLKDKRRIQNAVYSNLYSVSVK